MASAPMLFDFILILILDFHFHINYSIDVMFVDLGQHSIVTSSISTSCKIFVETNTKFSFEMMDGLC